MSEVKEHIKHLILLNKREEAIKALMDEYGLDESKANEFFDRYRESNIKNYDFGKITKGFAQGCGCFAVIFLAAFAVSVYTGIKALQDDDETIEAEVIGYYEFEELDAYDSIIYTYYDPIVRYEFEGQEQIDTLVLYTPYIEYQNGDIVKLDPETRSLSYAAYDEWDVLADSISYLFIALFAYMGYRALKKVNLNIPVPAKTEEGTTDDQDGK